MNGAFWPVIGTLGDRPVRPGCQSIPKCISRVPGRARTGLYASAPRAVSRFAGAPSHSHRIRPAMRAHALGRPCAQGTRPAERMRARAPSRAYAANEISRLPIGRARHLCAPIRDALARACLPVRAWSLKGRSARGRVRTTRASMRVRAVAHPCASCMRAVVLAPACVSPYAIARGCETHPRKGAPNRM